jgi:hypothetical protein
MENILIVHPSDPKSSFLNGIYCKMKDTADTSGGLSKKDFQRHIADFAQVMILGHGSQLGLYGSGQFPMEDD